MARDASEQLQPRGLAQRPRGMAHRGGLHGVEIGGEPVGADALAARHEVVAAAVVAVVFPGFGTELSAHEVVEGAGVLAGVVLARHEDGVSLLSASLAQEHLSQEGTVEVHVADEGDGAALLPFPGDELPHGRVGDEHLRLGVLLCLHHLLRRVPGGEGSGGVVVDVGEGLRRALPTPDDEGFPDALVLGEEALGSEAEHQLRPAAASQQRGVEDVE